MSFFNNLMQNVSKTVNNLNLQSRRFSFASGVAGVNEEQEVGVGGAEAAGGQATLTPVPVTSRTSAKSPSAGGGEQFVPLPHPAAAAAAAAATASSGGHITRSHHYSLRMNARPCTAAAAGCQKSTSTTKRLSLKGVDATPAVGAAGEHAGTSDATLHLQTDRETRRPDRSRVKCDLPNTGSHSGVQKSDGAYFEVMAGLRTECERQLKDTTATYNVKTNATSKHATKDATKDLSQQERESLYVEALYTIRHKVGSTASHHSDIEDELYDYVRTAFRLSQSQHRRMEEIAADEKPPIVILNLVVEQAEGLEAKDPNGFSDPYCMLGIVPGGVVRGEDTTSTSGMPAGSPPLSPRAARGSLPCTLENTLSPTASGVASGGASGGGSSASHEGPPTEKLRKNHSFRLSFKRKGDHKSSNIGASSAGSSSLSSAVGRRCSRASIASPTSLAGATPGGQTRRDSGAMLAVPAKFIRVTTVRPHTLTPRWSERFRFDIDDVSTDILHLDIWDHDDETSVLDAVRKLNEVKGVRGMARFFKQVAQSARSGSQDDFLGCINVPLQSIQSTGLDQWFVLEGRTSKSAVQGRIRLKMTLSTREDRGYSEEDSWSETVQQEKLLEIFVRHELSKFSDCARQWNGQLPSAASTILHQHAVQGDLNHLQQMVCKWRALLSCHLGGKTINYKVLASTLTELDDKYTDDALTYEEQEALATSFTSFVAHSLREVARLPQLCPVAKRPSTDSLAALLRCLAALSQSEVYQRALPFQRDVGGEVCQTLKKACHEWFCRWSGDGGSQSGRCMSGCDDGDGAEKSTTTLLLCAQAVRHTLVFCQHTRDHLQPAFQKYLGISCFALIYKQLQKRTMAYVGDVIDRAFDGHVQMAPSLSTSDDRSLTPAVDTAIFHVYMALQPLAELSELLTENDRSQLAIITFHCRFIPAITRWIQEVHFKILWRVGRAVELDQAVTPSQTDPGGGVYVRHSTSALDTAFCMNQVYEFWTSLQWPTDKQSEHWQDKLLESIVAGGRYYLELVERSYRHNNQQRATNDSIFCPPEMCAHMNNVEHVRRTVSDMVTKLNALSHSSGTISGKSYPSNVAGGGGVAMATTLITEMDTHIDTFCQTISEKMQPHLRRHIFHLAWSPDIVPAEEAICPLMDYLDECLVVLMDELMSSNFSRCLSHIWRLTALEINDQAASNTTNGSIVFYGRLARALDILLTFFNAEGRGLTELQLHTQLYCEVAQLLQLRGMTSRQLIERLHSERLQQQHEMALQSSVSQYGSVVMRAYHHHDSLTIEVLGARNLLPLDNNGLSDPYVIVELLPRAVFPNCQLQQTVVHKRTLNPLFDECFEYSVSVEQCRAENAAILFTMMDHDVLSHNDYGGECYLSLNHIPGVDTRGDKSDNFHGLKEVELQLMFPHDKDDVILKILEQRTDDAEAQNLVRQRRERINKNRQ